VVGIASSALLLIAVGANTNFVGLLALGTAMGFACSLADSPLNTVVYLSTPDYCRGRVAAVVDAVGCVGLLVGSAALAALVARTDVLTSTVLIGLPITVLAGSSLLLTQDISTHLTKATTEATS